jgi:hypothetical protein
MSLIEDNKKVKDFVARSIERLENFEYAYVCDGYIGDNSGGKYDRVIQANARRIVSKLLSLGYIHTTNHDFGCYDWSFSKEIEI